MHRLVSIGGSITQGMKNFAVFEPQLSYPSIIAHEMGLSNEEFCCCPFKEKGGLPMNIEYLLWRLDKEFGKDINVWELPLAGVFLREWMDEIEDYWERGPGTKALNFAGNFHNLAIWGFEIQDAYQVTAKMYEETVAKKKPVDDLLLQIPEYAMLRTAQRILNPSGSVDSKNLKAHQVQRATELAQKEGIENLIINLGANNVLKSVVALNYELSDDWIMQQKNPEYRTKKYHPHKKNITVYKPEHYERLLDTLMVKIERMNRGKGRVDRVFWGNVPAVTVFPVCHGVGGRMESDEGLSSPYGSSDHPLWFRRYFKYFTRPWISEARFKPDEDPHLTGKEIMEIDGIIARYNAILEEKVLRHNQQRQQQGKNPDWFIVDFHQFLEKLAYRRYREDPNVFPPPNWKQYEMPQEYQDLQLDTRFIRTKNRERVAGGLFSLDGVHPTTVSSGLIAQEVINVMQEQQVKFYQRDGKTLRSSPVRVNYHRLRRLDTLINNIPSTLDDLWEKLEDGDEVIDVFNRAFKALSKM